MKHCEILVVEDRVEDAELVRMALKEHGVGCTVHFVRDGAKAIELLDSLDRDPNALPLDLVLLDMHLPKRDGGDILKRLRSTERYGQTPVIVMTGLHSPAVEEQATKHAAMVYFRKPSTLDEYMR